MDESSKSAIDLNKFIVLIDNRKQQRLLRPSDNKNFKWRKINIKLNSLKQYEYYDIIEVGNDKLSLAEDQFEEEQQLDEQEEQQQVLNANNKEIYTLEAAQKLQAEEIIELKNTKNANQVINAIVSNNEQFEKRTAYSKQKYLAKKKKKYIFRFHAELPTIQNVHNFYFNTDLKGVGYIRWDMLAFMLLQGSPFQNVLLAERTKGILLGSLLKRQAKQITVCGDEVRNIKRYPIVEQLNISKESCQSKVQFTQWAKLVEQIKQKQGTKIRSYTNLMMLGNFNFQEILSKIEDSLSIGCVICLHCQNIEPLHDALNYMKTKNYYIHIKLFDMWAREYQVLKNRTHPMMYMSSHSGYLLTAFKVQ